MPRDPGRIDRAEGPDNKILPRDRFGRVIVQQCGRVIAPKLLKPMGIVLHRTGDRPTPHPSNLH